MLNDEIINFLLFYYHSVSPSYKSCHYLPVKSLALSSNYSRQSALGRYEASKIVVPFCREENYWVLLLIEYSTKTFVVYDPMHKQTDWERVSYLDLILCHPLLLNFIKVLHDILENDGHPTDGWYIDNTVSVHTSPSLILHVEIYRNVRLNPTMRTVVCT